MIAYPPHRPVEEIVAPALEQYGRDLDEHGHDYAAENPRCRCGYKPPREPHDRRTRGLARRSVGMHVAAAEKRASKAYSAAAERLLDQARRDRDAEIARLRREAQERDR